MKIWKTAVLFYLGGSAYMILEFLWRGRSHGSMFMLGGLCFLLVGGALGRAKRIPLALRLMLGSGVITALELATGLAVNRDYGVWDYRQMPYQFQGQICLMYSLLWIPVSLLAMGLYRLAQKAWK
jgi:uncharacterized membrane protein